MEEKQERIETKVIVVDPAAPDESAIEEAGAVLREGGLVAFPTETVYGLGGDALNPGSSRKIYAAKGRPSDNPLIVHIARFEDLYRIAKTVPDAAKLLADRFWPGPMTLVLPKSEDVPCETTGGLDTVAVRWPSDPIAQRLILAGGGYVAAPSANRSGRPSPTSAKYCVEDLDGRVEMILDGGDCGLGLESTIIDLTGEVPMILRPGYITEEMLSEVVGAVEIDQAVLSSDTGLRPKAPGMKYRHYAPQGELVIVRGEAQKVSEWINREVQKAKEDGYRTGVIGTEATIGGYFADSCKSAGRREEEESIARELYRILREFDDEGIERIYSESFDEGILGQAIMNRLLKAAGHRIVEV